MKDQIRSFLEYWSQTVMPISGINKMYVKLATSLLASLAGKNNKMKRERKKSTKKKEKRKCLIN